MRHLEPIYEIDPITDETWMQLVSRTPVNLFHSPRWMKVIAESFQIGFRAGIVERGGMPAAGVAWCDLDDIFGRRRVTLPFTDFSDIVAETAAFTKEVMDYAMAAGVPWILRSHDPALEPEGDWTVAKRMFSHHIIDVTPDEQELFGSLSSMARRNTRRADSGEVEVFEATSKDELRTWVEIHMGLRRSKFRLFAQPYSFFENIWDEFIAQGDGFLLLARHNGQIIAGTVYIVSGDTCYYKFNASNLEGLKLRPNNALMWHGMLRAKERGLRAVDLGRTNVSQTGLQAFKASYGGVSSDMIEYSFTPAGFETTSSQRQTREVVSDLTTLLTARDVPEALSEAAGRLLYRYFA